MEEKIKQIIQQIFDTNPSTHRSKEPLKYLLQTESQNSVVKMELHSDEVHMA